MENISMCQRIIIAGSRDFTDYDYLEREVDSYFKKIEVDKTKVTIISGAARGVDRLGEVYAEKHNIDLVRCPADWKRYGKAAGPKRNGEMAAYSMADGCVGVLLAFWNGKSSGTKNMIDTANKYNLKVHIINI